MSDPMSFAARLESVRAKRGPFCLGLDPSAATLKAWSLPDSAEGARTFCLRMLEAAGDRVALFKPQAAYFERLGPEGWSVVQEVAAEVRARGGLTILDAKRGDIGATNDAYAQAYLSPSGPYAVDALTVHPYLGLDALLSLFRAAAEAAAGVFVVVLSSNLEAWPTQHALVDREVDVCSRLAQGISRLNAALTDEAVGPIGAVVGATAPEAARVAAELPRSLILAPGVGAQGASFESLGQQLGFAAGRIIPSSSRAIAAEGPGLNALRAAIHRNADDAQEALGCSGDSRPGRQGTVVARISRNFALDRWLDVRDGSIPWPVAAEDESSRSNPPAYMNNASTSYPKSALAIASYLRCLSRLPRGERHGRRSEGWIARARQRVAVLLGVEEREIFFSSGATLALNQVIQGVHRPQTSVLVDNRSHNAVLRTVANLQSAHYRLLELYSSDEQLETGCLSERRDEDVSLICLTHASNVTGSVYPVERIVPLIRATWPPARILVDCSQSAGMVALQDVAKVADYVVFPSHKHLCGPGGAAVMMARRELVPVIFGGTGSNSSQLEVEGSWSGWLEVGTPNEAAIWATAEALDDSERNLQRYQERDRELRQMLIEGMRGIEGLEVVTGSASSGPKLATVACRPRFGHAEIDWAPLLHSQGVITRGGMHCAPLVHQQLGLTRTGTLRLSPGRFTSNAEIERTLDVLAESGRILRKLGVER